MAMLVVKCCSLSLLALNFFVDVNEDYKILSGGFEDVYCACGLFCSYVWQKNYNI